MKKGTSLVLRFLVQLAGFILGGVAGWFLVVLALWLVLGAPGVERSAVIFAPMLLLGPVGFFIGGFVAMKLAGKWFKASANHNAGPGVPGGQG